MKELIQSYLQVNVGVLTPTTLMAYRQRLDSFADYVGNRTPTPVIVRNWLSRLLENGVSRGTAKTYYATARSFYEWLVAMELVESNPVPKLRRFDVQSSERRAMTEEDKDLIVAKARELGKRDWVFMTLCGWHTGMRLGDCATLCKDEVDFENAIITRIPQKTKRFGKVVKIPIPTELIEAIRDCEPYPDGNQDYVCPALAQKYLWDQHRTLSTEFIRLARKAGAKCSYHSTRHARVSTLLNANVNIAIIQSITGHSLKQISSYAHISTTAQREALGIK